MVNLRKNYGKLVFPFMIVAGSSALLLAGLHSFLLFHTLVELFTVVIAFGMFAIAWSSRRYISNIFLLLIGISSLFVGSLDLIHALTYKGLNLIGGFEANLPTQLWIAARYLEAFSFLAAFLFSQEKNPKNFALARRKSHWIFLVYAFIFGAIIVSLFFSDLFPDAYREGVGLTSFKIYSEYLISLVFFFSVTLLFWKRAEFDREMSNLLSLALILKIFSELAFTEYVGVYDFANMLGHLLRFVSTVLLYKAVLEGALMRPYQIIFSDLQKSEERYRSLVELSPDPIVVHSQGFILYANTPAQKLFGTEEAKKIIGAELAGFFHPDYREQMKTRIKKVSNGELKRTPMTEMEVLRPDGQKVPVEIKGMKIIFAGRPAVESIIRDISDRRAMEKELARTQAELQKRVEDQLLESHKYLGLVNRKISLLLEIEKHSQSRENKQEIMDYLVVSALGLSSAKVALLYVASGKNHFNLVSHSGLEKDALKYLQIVSGADASFIHPLMQEKKRVNGPCELVDPGCFNHVLNISYFVALPIFSGELCKGFIFLGFTDRISMDPQDLDFLDVFSRHISAALQNAGILN